MEATPRGDPSPEDAPGLFERLRQEARRHAYAYVLTGLFAAAGAVGAPLLVPEAPPLLAGFGGLVFGIYASLNALAHRFLG